MFYEAAAQLIGEPQLLAALRDLVNERRFGRATPQDLKSALVRGSGGHASEMKALWKHWFEELHGVEDLGELDVGGIAGSMGLNLGGLDLGGLMGSPQDTAAALKEMENLMRQMGDAP